MQDKLIFVIGPPRSGSTMLQRMLGSHTAIFSHPEPHIITPLAHLGYYAKVDKAPYDHINAAEAIREFVQDLPAGEQDYLDACRSYCDILYGRMLKKSGKQMLLDKTPAYALVLPFLAKLYPQAKYVVLTRHPLAVLSSYANSFFDGDYAAAVEFNDILGRYLPSMAKFLRQKNVPHLQVSYEDLVSQPEEKLAAIFSFLGLPNQADAVDYGKHEHLDKSYGDPKVKHQTRPTSGSLNKWAEELAADSHKLDIAESIVEQLSQRDLAAWGYDKSTLFEPVANAVGIPPKSDWKWMFDSYRLKRKVFLGLRKNIQRNQFGKAVRKLKYYCDVLLRE
ncbi:MAG: sulfotransferase [Deltaproteobacteria bacterium]|nr:sulfotransferase [Deltaproteobacteria bacterium]